ncbi:MAG TPA: hypothetical protein VHT26_13280 [Trebonia sp.]|jgi:hypothetical protein|nr:hypothetical protein [Trebonia sp.]
MLDPLAAGDALAAGALAAGVLEVEAVDDVLGDELELHAPISSTAIAVTAAPATMRAR